MGKLRLCGVCCRAHCCGALGAVFADGGQSGRRFCRAAGRAGPSYGSGETSAVPPSPQSAARGIPSSGSASRPISKSICKKARFRGPFFGAALFFRHCRTKMEALSGERPSGRPARCRNVRRSERKCRRGKNRTCVFRLFVLKSGLVKRVFGKTRLPGDQLDGVFFRQPLLDLCANQRRARF